MAGAGRAAAAAARALEALREYGNDAVLEPTRIEPTTQWLDGILRGSDLLVVVGGDGAVRMAAGAASRRGVAVYHLPLGTENLFAREFGMDDRVETLVRAIEKFEVREVDVGVANERPFLLMASVGYDAEVVHDLAQRRGKSISHWSYVAPVLAQIRRWQPPVLEVWVDGERIDDGGPGFVVVGNSRHYGWRLNPCGRASMSDGELDVAYFPTRGRLAMVRWAVRCRLQRHLAHKRLAYRVGRKVRIASAATQRYQLDGDPPGPAESAPAGNGAGVGFELHVGVRPKALRVLTP
ncbi:MAG: hypothetical protein L0219_16215 [Phycisphaerales bacterium]|nr:hypothetical protein [Phycisphaerales bacterium]